MKSTTTNKKPDAVGSAEYQVIADRVMFPELSLKLAKTYCLTADDFETEECRNAWCALEDAGNPTDSVQSTSTIIQALNWNRDDESAMINGRKRIDWLLDQQSTGTVFAIARRIHAVALASYIRQVRAAVTAALATSPSDAISYDLTIRDAIASVPRPRSIADTRLEHLTEASIYGEEIPEDKLHAPGIIDAIVDYSLKSAISPHRTLAFSGALALMAHLMGRKYTDPSGKTRSNLYVIAIGPSGIGKENAITVNRCLVENFHFIKSTVRGEIASGQALEDVLDHFTAAMFQIDEVQSLFRQLSNGTDSNSIYLMKSLMKFYSSDGKSVPLRDRANSPGGRNNIGRSVLDPSLTIYGTGTDDGFYKAIAENQIEEGLIGRCLIFHAVHPVSELNIKTSKETLKVPTIVTQFIEHCETENTRAGRDREPNPTCAEYDEGAAEEQLRYSRIAREEKKRAQEAADLVSAAIWGRVDDKIAKLALIFAVSREYLTPRLTIDDFRRAWDLVSLLARDTIRMIKDNLVPDDIEAGYKAVLRYITATTLSRRKQGDMTAVTRSDISIHCRTTKNLAKNMSIIDRLLIERGMVAIKRSSRTTYYILKDAYASSSPAKDQAKGDNENDNAE